MKDTQGYLESWSREIKSTANTVRDLIGDAHWLSDGHHREVVLRDFISRYVPNSASVDSGFVKPPNSTQNCSREIDILVSDLESHTPYYSRAGLKVIPPQSLLACMEVKSEWSKKKLGEALLNICHTQLITEKYCPADQVWRGVCFYGSLTTRKIGNISQLIESVVLEQILPLLISSGIDKPDGKSVLLYLPTCVFNLENFVLFFSESSDPASLDLRLFHSGDISPAYALVDMFDCIRFRTCGIASDDISSMVDGLEIVNIKNIRI